MASVKGILVEIGGDVSGLQKALNKVNTMSSSLGKELNKINSLLKLDPNNTTLLANKQEALSEQIETTTKKLEELKEAQEMADNKILEGGEISKEKYRALQAEIIKTEQKLALLKAEASNWNKAGDALVEYGNKISKISDKLDNLGNSLTTKLTLPILGVSTILLNSAKNFETAFTGVEKTVDGTEEQLANLKQGIKDMAEVVPSTTTEIAAVAEAAGQLGIETDNILGFTKAMIDLGNSTNLTADEAASELAKFANITKMSQKDFNKLGSSIVDLGNNFATTEADIVSMAMRLAGAGAQVGMSEGEILGLATALSSVGIEAEMGGSAISKAMVKMENAVELGGTKLNEVLKKTGTSLRNLELMSANDSKSFRELSQSIGMTSTEVKQLITAGTNLEDFAKISGMTAKEFKKAWKEDASGALSEFIKGLANAEDKGESAISMLSEMGFSEVRLRDSLLRAANAQGLFSEAIKTGTEAFDENVALTNEANKRYQTLDSRIETTKNKFRNLATTMGDKLTPKANEVLDKVDNLIDKFDDLSEEELETIIKTSALVATIGPAIKIISVFGKTTGTTITTIGNFSKAIANVKNGVKTADGQVGTFTTTLTKLLSPTGLATTGIIALTAATYMYAKRQAEEITSLNGVRAAIDEQKLSLENIREARDEYYKANSNEIMILQRLSTELGIIVDENGKVKAGYADRANFIVTELNNALGTEISLNNGIISNYREMQTEIDNLINKKKAEILLRTYEDEYAEAIRGQSDATANLIDLRTQLKDTTEQMMNSTGKEAADARLKIGEISNAIKEENDLLNQYNYTIGNYEALQTASISGTAEELETALGHMRLSWETYQIETKKIVDEGPTYVNEETLRMSNLLKTNTSIPEAAGDLAERSTILFLQENEKMETGTEQNLSDVKNIIDANTEVERASGDLGADSSTNFREKANTVSVGEDFDLGIINGINNRRGEVFGSVHSLGQNMISALRASINSHSPSKETMNIGEDFDAGILLGIVNSKNSILKEVEKIGKDSVKKLDSNMNLNEVGSFGNKMSAQVINKTRAIFTTPQIIFNVQKMDEKNLESCFEYINKKFGSAY